LTNNDDGRQEFEWDEGKRQATLRDRRVDVLEAALIFEGPVTTIEDKRKDYGERRFRSIGLVGGIRYLVAYTFRAGKIRLITAWKVSEDDLARYQDGVTGGHPGDEGPR
jgi:uncharacterized protein